MKRSISFWLLAALTLGGALQACKKSTPPPAATKAPQKSVQKASPPRKRGEKNVVLFLGDSLTAGFGLASSEAYPALIQQLWRKKGLAWEVQNAGVSGDTTAGVLRRLNWVLSERTYAVFLCIGANDGLRGLSLKQMRKNLDTIIRRIRKRGILVILAGMRIPPNYGPKYTKNFRQIYIDLARAHKLPRMPFLLQNVAGQAQLNLSDGIHPNTQGHQIVARDVMAFFQKRGLLQRKHAPGGKP